MTTTPPPEAPRDPVIERVERIIARLLRWGVLASLFIMLAGLSIHFAQGGNTQAIHFGQSSDAVTLKQMLQFNHGTGLIVLGLILLILTPVLRVVVSIIAYVIERDRVFIAITTAVLTLLIISMLVGGAA